MRILQRSILFAFVLTIGTFGLFAAPLSEQPVEQVQETPAVIVESSRRSPVTLTLDFTAEEETYRYSYIQQIIQAPGTPVRLPSRSQIRFNPGQIGFLASWSDGKNTYEAGETITMPDKDTSLTATYEEGVLFYDPIHEIEYYSSDRVVTVPSVPDDDEDRVFVGWYDRQSDTLLTEDTYERTTSGACFRPVYKSLVFTRIALHSYNSNAVPRNTALSLSFAYRNRGDFVMNDITASLECDHGLVRILDPQPQRRTLRPNESNHHPDFFGRRTSEDSFTFVIDGSVPSGSELPFTLTVTDEDGISFSKTFTLIVQ